MKAWRMQDRHLVAVPCKLSKGIFSDERVFEVRLADGQIYTGVAPRYFCWDASGKLVGQKDALDEVEGFVAARIVYDIDDSQVAVEVPDTEVLAVRWEQVKDRPTPIVPPSPTTRET